MSANDPKEPNQIMTRDNFDEMLKNMQAQFHQANIKALSTINDSISKQTAEIENVQANQKKADQNSRNDSVDVKKNQVSIANIIEELQNKTIDQIDQSQKNTAELTQELHDKQTKNNEDSYSMLNDTLENTKKEIIDIADYDKVRKDNTSLLESLLTKKKINKSKFKSNSDEEESILKSINTNTDSISKSNSLLAKLFERKEDREDRESLSKFKEGKKSKDNDDISKLLKLLSKDKKKEEGFFSKLLSGLMTSLIGPALLIAGKVALVVGAAALLYKYSDTIKSAVKSLGEWTKNIYTEASGLVKQLIRNREQEKQLVDMRKKGSEKRAEYAKMKVEDLKHGQESYGSSIFKSADGKILNKTQRKMKAEDMQEKVADVRTELAEIENRKEERKKFYKETTGFSGLKNNILDMFNVGEGKDLISKVYDRQKHDRQAKEDAKREEELRYREQLLVDNQKRLREGKIKPKDSLQKTIDDPEYDREFRRRMRLLSEGNKADLIKRKTEITTGKSWEQINKDREDYFSKENIEKRKREAERNIIKDKKIRATLSLEKQGHLPLPLAKMQDDDISSGIPSLLKKETGQTAIKRVEPKDEKVINKLDELIDITKKGNRTYEEIQDDKKKTIMRAMNEAQTLNNGKVGNALLASNPDLIKQTK